MDTILELVRRRFGAGAATGLQPAERPTEVGLEPTEVEDRNTDILGGIDQLSPPNGPRVVLKSAHEPEARVALAREVEATLRVAHPALRRVRASVAEAGGALAALERVDGTALDAHLARRPDDAERVTRALLGVLRALHEAGLAHGDLKPEHVLVEADGRVRLIDLGLATPLGATVVGGTHGFLAPELLRGAAVSVASDLFALGWTLVAAAGASADAWSPRLAALVGSACEAEPRQRPASAGSALAALGVAAGTAGGRFGFDAAARAACGHLDSGALVCVEGAPGSGRSALARGLVEERLSRGLTTLDLCAGAGFDPLLALADVLEVPACDEPTQRVSLAVARVAALGVPLVLDDADALDEDGRASLEAAARTLHAAGSGALVMVGADAGAFRGLPHVLVGLRPLDADATRRLLDDAGARSDPATVRAVLDATHGRAGDLARVGSALASTPELSAADALDALPTRDALPRAEPENSLDEARRALARGAPRRAAAMLRALPPTTLDAQLLLARAEAAAGNLDTACALFALHAEHAPLDVRLEQARLLERLGRHTEARDGALAVLRLRDASSTDAPPTPEQAAQAASIAAASLLALGEPRLADEVARTAAALPCEPRLRARLAALRSDAALRRNEPRAALDRAAEAEAAARESGEDASLAHALARSAAAHALSGEPHRARERWREALAAAERAADVAALPPYLMNLATAEHALGEFGDALRLYERAAVLAERLGRRGSRAAALTNLAGLLALLEADDDALRVLADARAAAEAAGAALYVAQTMLIEAEVLARRDPPRAAGCAMDAQRAFEACGAGRQALEAELLSAELAQQRGDGAAALTTIERRSSALAEAGLGARASLLTAKSRLASGSLDAARRGVEEALAGARALGDRDLEARALALAAEVHDALGTGLGEALRARAREALGELAARMPTGLRERYLGAPVRAALLHPTRKADAALDAGGLGRDARRLLALVGRVLLEPDEQRVLELALDETVALVRAERAFLLRGRGDKPPEVAVARNLDRESVRQSRFRFSRSVAERVLATGEPLVTADAADDPALSGARSVLALGLRSILCVPVRSPTGVIGALYLDHRFEKGRFDDHDRELVQALADVIGLALENGRLHREAAQRTDELTRAHASLELESQQKDRELERLSRALARGDAWVPNDEGILGRSPALRAALDVARRVAPSDLPVLLEGESGTGKELFARFVHAKSRRGSGPFVALNCGALPEALIESELFGHVRGAFTGAVRDHPGTFRAASGGTLLLDEIGELPLRMQTRLLRVLQEREVVPVGASAPVPVDVRVLAATNRDLEREVEAGRFRRDLYFRLNGVRLRLPALRERREDLPAIADAALERIAREPGMRKATLSRAALAALLAHDWPGNVRELEQALRRAVAIADEPALGPEHFELGDARPAARADAHRTLDRSLVEKALRGASGNRTLAARTLGISRVTLHRAITKLAVDVPGRLGRPRKPK